MEQERNRDHPSLPSTSRNSRRHDRNGILMVPRHIRSSTTIPDRRKRNPLIRKPALQQRDQRNTLPQKHWNGTHYTSQLLRRRPKRQRMRQTNGMVKRTLRTNNARPTLPQHTRLTLDYMLVDRLTVHIPERKRLHDHSGHSPQQPVLVHNREITSRIHITRIPGHAGFDPHEPTSEKPSPITSLSLSAR